MQEENHTFSDYLRRTDMLAERLGLKLSDLPDVLGCSKAMLFAYRKGTNRITNKVWLRLEAAELSAGIGKLEEPPPSASSSAASAPLRLSSSADPELLAVLLRMADALEAVQRGTAKSEGMLGKIVAAQERIAAALERLADQPKDNL